jgi:hypothetical protein
VSFVAAENGSGSRRRTVQREGRWPIFRVKMDVEIVALLPKAEGKITRC